MGCNNRFNCWLCDRIGEYLCVALILLLGAIYILNVVPAAQVEMWLGLRVKDWKLVKLGNAEV
jgi:hypothetical protein